MAILVYGYCVSVFSSRKLEMATYDSEAFRLNTSPEFKGI